MKKTINKSLVFTTVLSFMLASCVIFASCKAATIKEGQFPNTVAENAQVNEKYLPAATEMKDFTIKEFTDNISQIPRNSGEVDQIRQYIYN